MQTAVRAPHGRDVNRVDELWLPARGSVRVLVCLEVSKDFPLELIGSPICLGVLDEQLARRRTTTPWS